MIFDESTAGVAECATADARWAVGGGLLLAGASVLVTGHHSPASWPRSGRAPLAWCPRRVVQRDDLSTRITPSELSAHERCVDEAGCARRG